MSTAIAALIASVLLLPAGEASPPARTGPAEAGVAVPQFHRPSDAELSNARARLLHAAAESEKTLSKSPDGAVIAEDIGLAKLRSLCQSDRLNVEFLDAIYRGVSNGAAGREDEHILRLRAAVAQHAAQFGGLHRLFQ